MVQDWSDSPIELSTNSTINDGIPFDELKKDKEEDTQKRKNYEDILLSKLESLCTIFDNIYFMKSVGIISENNFFYRKLNNGNIGSKLWFITLILSARKLGKELFRVIKTRMRCKKELAQLQKYQNGKTVINSVLTDKLNQQLQKCHSMIKDILFEFLQNFVYMYLVLFDILKISGQKKFKQYMESFSNIITILRVFNTGASRA